MAQPQVSYYIVIVHCTLTTGSCKPIWNVVRWVFFVLVHCLMLKHDLPWAESQIVPEWPMTMNPTTGAGDNDLMPLKRNWEGNGYPWAIRHLDWITIISICDSVHLESSDRQCRQRHHDIRDKTLTKTDITLPWQCTCQLNDLKVKIYIDKINTHSLQGFSGYIKTNYLQCYLENCTIMDCYVCKN